MGGSEREREGAGVGGRKCEGAGGSEREWEGGQTGETATAAVSLFVINRKAKD